MTQAAYSTVNYLTGGAAKRSAGARIVPQTTKALRTQQEHNSISRRGSTCPVNLGVLSVRFVLIFLRYWGKQQTTLSIPSF